jgi:phosphomannomutase
MVSYYKSHFRDLQQVLDAQAREYGVYATDQLSVRMNDLAQIPAAVAKLRANPPRKVGGLAVTEFVDLSLGYNGLPPTDGVMLLLAGGRVIARPSGTEPKLKCYLEAIVKTNDVDADRRQAQRILDSMKTDMKAVFGV